MTGHDWIFLYVLFEVEIGKIIIKYVKKTAEETIENLHSWIYNHPRVGN